MAQQSARRGWDNQGFPLCFEHATGDLDPVRELPYRPAAVLPHQGRTDDSIRPRATTIQRFPLPERGRPQMESRLRDSELFLLVLALVIGVAAGLGVVLIDLLLSLLRQAAFDIPSDAHLSDL